MNERQKQVIISGWLGDGTLPKNGKNHYFETGCKYKSYVDFKASILNNILRPKFYSIRPSGYTGNGIHYITTRNHIYITRVANMSLDEILNKLNDFGIALWFYDDGSLHKTKFFYNLNTQAFSYGENQVIAKYLENRFNIKCVIRRDKSYYYISINKLGGADKINSLLKKYPIDCYKYKTAEDSKFDAIRNISRGKPVLIDNIKYACILDAAITLNLSKRYLARAFRLGKISYRGYSISKV